jgi:hypothetical protein
VSRQLPITWQRLVDARGETCDRCDATHRHLLGALEKLKQALHPLGIEPTLEVREIDAASFARAPTESNRIWIAGKPLEDWLGAGVGQTRCCSACGDSQCRTLEVGPAVYEAIPEEILVGAALAAASGLLRAPPGAR